MMLLVILFVVAAIMVLIGLVCYWAWEILKFYRCRKWCEAHDGILVGSDEWAEWCINNGIYTNYFI